MQLFGRLEHEGAIRPKDATFEGAPLGRLDTQKIGEVFKRCVVFVDQRGPDADARSFTGRMYSKWGIPEKADPLQAGERIVCLNCREFALFSQCPHAYAVHMMRNGSHERQTRKRTRGRPPKKTTNDEARLNRQEAARKRRKTVESRRPARKSPQEHAAETAPNPTQRRPPARGIANVANNCYMNAILQVLVTGANLRFPSGPSAHQSRCGGQEFCAACALCQFVQSVVNWEQPPAQPAIWIDNLARISPTLREGSHEDPHEFLVPMLDLASERFKAADSQGGNILDDFFAFKTAQQVQWPPGRFFFTTSCLCVEMGPGILYSGAPAVSAYQTNPVNFRRFTQTRAYEI